MTTNGTKKDAIDNLVDELNQAETAYEFEVLFDLLFRKQGVAVKKHGKVFLRVGLIMGEESVSKNGRKLVEKEIKRLENFLK